jgi:hypothetical protein
MLDPFHINIAAPLIEIVVMQKNEDVRKKNDGQINKQGIQDRFKRALLKDKVNYLLDDDDIGHIGSGGEDDIKQGRKQITGNISGDQNNHSQVVSDYFTHIVSLLVPYNFPPGL